MSNLDKQLCNERSVAARERTASEVLNQARAEPTIFEFSLPAPPSMPQSLRIEQGNYSPELICQARSSAAFLNKRHAAGC